MENNNFWGYEPVMAVANIKGSSAYPDIDGRVIFKKKNDGVLVTAEIMGLPENGTTNNTGIFGFHIHEGEECTGNENDEFANVGGHYNPEKLQHPYHVGDLPPLFASNGYAYMSVYTDRVNLKEIIGRTVIIHREKDDFNTQPGGNSGLKIACGVILIT